MLKSIPAKAFAALFLGLAAALMPVRQADAAIFIGTFDPSFGGNLADLGFRGQATFDIPDACLGQTGFLVSNSAPCSNGAMSMTSATVELYRFTSPLAPPPPTLFTTSFAPPPVSLIDALFDTNPLTGQPRLLGVNTPVVGPRLVNVADLIGPIYSGNLWLEFHQPAPFNGDVIGLLAVDPFAPAGAYLFACNPRLEQDTSSPNCAQIQSNVALVTFTRVPEPATAGLVLLAIAGIAAVRRRRTIAAA